MRYVRLILVGLALSGAAGYGAYARLGNESASPDARAAQKASPPAEAPRIAVVSAVATRQDVPVTRRSVGWVEPVATVMVRARVEGEVVEQLVRDGQIVKKGDLLFRIDDREIRAAIAKDEAALARDQATLARAQADARRARDLLEKRVAAPQQVDQAEAEAKIAAANIQADQAALDADRIRLGYTQVRAPIDGRLGVVRVTPGNIVRASDGGEGLVTITQMKPLRISFTLPERDLPTLRAAAAQGEVPVRVLAHGGTGPQGQGTLDFIDSGVDPTSGTITAKALLPNEDGSLWPGQYVDVEIELGRHEHAVTVPLAAVQPGQDGPFVYVVGADGKVAVRKVVTGETHGDVVVVDKGIEPGEHVVIEGQQRLRDGTRVAEKVTGAGGTGTKQGAGA
ncbi:efflux RND transporter periplasmic adaptor subunit [Benzoatithermus flavus]|uniref:Efflux RND transporter periplasmic adaptor subunit n=1 Tax=Benzoatithermus flavus TaxID=3108223 RepID=A0ABU8XXM5_9PROT